jgi:hypothetical protein
MTVIKARFDGRVFVPHEPVNLPVGFELEIPITNGEQSAGDEQPSACDEAPDAAKSFPPDVERGSGLRGLAEVARRFPAMSEAPEDYAAEVDHYLYGLPKRNQ